MKLFNWLMPALQVFKKRNKVGEFAIHHLNVEMLYEMSRETNFENEAIARRAREVCEQYKRLRDTCQLRNSNEKTSLWKQKGESAKWLFNNGYYTHVANIQASCVQEAVTRSGAVPGVWYWKPQVKVISIPDCVTGKLDIVEYEGQYFMVVTGGYFCLSSMRRVTRMDMVIKGEDGAKRR